MTASAKTLRALERAAVPLFTLQFKLGCPCVACKRKWRAFEKAYRHAAALKRKRTGRR